MKQPECQKGRWFVGGSYTRWNIRQQWEWENYSDTQGKGASREHNGKLKKPDKVYPLQDPI